MVPNEELQETIEPQETIEEQKNKTFELLDGEVREIEDNEAEKFFSNPRSASKSLQKKYLGITEEEYKEQENFKGEIPKGFELETKTFYNPFLKKDYEVKILKEKPKKSKQEVIEELKQKLIDDTITTQEIEKLKLLTL